MSINNPLICNIIQKLVQTGEVSYW